MSVTFKITKEQYIFITSWQDATQTGFHINMCGNDLTDKGNICICALFWKIVSFSVNVSGNINWIIMLPNA